MVFPLFKLGYLALRQISKPLAKGIKEKAKSSPFLRNKILLPPAQMYHYFDTNVKMRLLGMGKVTKVQPLNEEMAIDLAAEMLGEIIIFSVAAGTIWFEYRRQSRKDQDKESLQNTRLDDLERNIQDMGLRIEEQSARINELTRLVASLPQSGTSPAGSSKTQYNIRDPKSGTVLTVIPR